MDNKWTTLNPGDAIKEMAKESKLSQKRMAEEAGYKSVSSVALPIARGNLKLHTLLKLADAAGFDVVLVKRENLAGYNPIKIDMEPEKKGS